MTAASHTFYSFSDVLNFVSLVERFLLQTSFSPPCNDILCRIVYWGEYPLSFAACSNQKDMLEVLLRCGADLRAKDTNGNNVLHMMVIHNNKVNVWLSIIAKN